MPVGSIQDIVEQTLKGMDYELVELEFGQKGLLRVFIDSAAGIRMEDCERVSRQLSHVLAVENVDYSRLEVSSPGVDRPLRTERDFCRFAGEEITLRLRLPLAGRRNFQGVLSVEPEGKFGVSWRDQPKAPEKGRRSAGRQVVRGKASASKVSEAGKAGEAGDMDTGHKLVFSLDEIERARLVPKLKF